MHRVTMPGQLHTFMEEEEAPAASAATTVAEAEDDTPTTGVQTRASKKAAVVPGSGRLLQLPDDLKRKIVTMAIHPWRPGLGQALAGEVLETFKLARSTCAALLLTRKRSEPATRAMRLILYRHTFCIWQMQARLELLTKHFNRNSDLLAQSQKQDNEQYKLVCALAGKNPEMWKVALQSLKDSKK